MSTLCKIETGHDESAWEGWHWPLEIDMSKIMAREIRTYFDALEISCTAGAEDITRNKEIVLRLWEASGAWCILTPPLHVLLARLVDNAPDCVDGEELATAALERLSKEVAALLDKLKSPKD